jgi:para-nitrobenzyl esterase
MRFAALVLVGVVAAACTRGVSVKTPTGDQPPPAAATLPPEVLEVTWEWVSLTTPVETVTPGEPQQYTLTFTREGRVAMRADCNRGNGTYVVGVDRRITFGLFALTRAACPPGSQSDRFVRDVGRSTSYFVRNAELYLEMPVDSGTLRFRQSRAK